MANLPATIARAARARVAVLTEPTLQELGANPEEIAMGEEVGPAQEPEREPTGELLRPAPERAGTTPGIQGLPEPRPGFMRTNALTVPVNTRVVRSYAEAHRGAVSRAAKGRVQRGARHGK